MWSETRSVTRGRSVAASNSTTGGLEDHLAVVQARSRIAGVFERGAHGAADSPPACQQAGIGGSDAKSGRRALCGEGGIGFFHAQARLLDRPRLQVDPRARDAGIRSVTVIFESIVEDSALDEEVFPFVTEVT